MRRKKPELPNLLELEVKQASPYHTNLPVLLFWRLLLKMDKKTTTAVMSREEIVKVIPEEKIDWVINELTKEGIIEVKGDVFKVHMENVGRHSNGK